MLSTWSPRLYIGVVCNVVAARWGVWNSGCGRHTQYNNLDSVFLFNLLSDTSTYKYGLLLKDAVCSDEQYIKRLVNVKRNTSLQSLSTHLIRALLCFIFIVAGGFIYCFGYLLSRQPEFVGFIAAALKPSPHCYYWVKCSFVFYLKQCSVAFLKYGFKVLHVKCNSTDDEQMPL